MSKTDLSIEDNSFELNSSDGVLILNENVEALHNESHKVQSESLPWLTLLCDTYYLHNAFVYCHTRISTEGSPRRVIKYVCKE